MTRQTGNTDRQSITFDPESPEGKILKKWWDDLQINRGDRADLARATSLSDIVFCPAFHTLYQRLVQGGYGGNPKRWAIVAGLAAQVRQIDGKYPFPEQLGRPHAPGGSAPVKGLRFRRLLKVKQDEDLFLQLGRIVRQLDRRVHLLDLARGCYWWNDRTRQQWALSYYGVASQET